VFLRYYSARGQSIAPVSLTVIETDELKDEGILPRAYWFSPGRTKPQECHLSRETAGHADVIVLHLYRYKLQSGRSIVRGISTPWRNLAHATITASSRMTDDRV